MGIENLNLNELFQNLFEDKNKNGIPDLFEQKTTDNNGNVQISSSSKIYFEGKEYNSIDELPPAAKEEFQQALQKMQVLRQKTEGTSFTNSSTNTKCNTDQVIQNYTSSGTNNPTPSFHSSSYTTSEDIENKNAPLLGISKKWLYAVALIAIAFVIWWFKYHKS